MTAVQDRLTATATATGGAATSSPLHPVLADRWSTRALDSAALSDGDVASLLEAARWAPSAMNHQPWRFLVGRQDVEGPDATHAGLLAAMAPPNRAWAQHAPLLLAAVVRVVEEDGAPRTVGPYELGLAVAQLTAQATALGLSVHQVGGFDHDAVAERFHVPASYRPVVLLAVGRQGDAAHLPDWARARETAPRTRLPLSDIAYEGTFGHPATFTTTGQADQAA